MDVNHSQCTKGDPDTRVQFPSDKGYNGLYLRIGFFQIILKNKTCTIIETGSVFYDHC